MATRATEMETAGRGADAGEHDVRGRGRSVLVHVDGIDDRSDAAGELHDDDDGDGGAGQLSNNAWSETTNLVAKTERPGNMGVYTLLVDRTRRQT